MKKKVIDNNATTKVVEPKKTRAKKNIVHQESDSDSHESSAKMVSKSKKTEAAAMLKSDVKVLPACQVK